MLLRKMFPPCREKRSRGEKREITPFRVLLKVKVKGDKS
jgi:hypothetical protein